MIDDEITSDYAASSVSSFASPSTDATEYTSPQPSARAHLNDLTFRKAQQRPARLSEDNGFLTFRVSPLCPTRPFTLPDDYLLTQAQHPRASIVSNKRRRRKQQDDAEDQSNSSTWLATRLVAGMRGDPFNSFPIEPRDCVPQAVDNCRLRQGSPRCLWCSLATVVQVFIPERVLRPFQSVPGIERLAHEYFQLVISDVGMFEATIAQVEANSAVMAGARKPTKEVMLHHGRALDHLQQRLVDPERRLEDLTFHIIISIMGTHVSRTPTSSDCR